MLRKAGALQWVTRFVKQTVLKCTDVRYAYLASMVADDKLSKKYLLAEGVLQQAASRSTDNKLNGVFAVAMVSLCLHLPWCWRGILKISTFMEDDAQGVQRAFENLVDIARNQKYHTKPQAHKIGDVLQRRKLHCGLFKLG